MDTLPSQVQGGSEFSIGQNEVCPLLPRRWDKLPLPTVIECTRSVWYRRQEPRVRCTAAVGNDGNNVEF